MVFGTTLILASAACTVLLDRSATQCQTDDDCTKFGGHPFCQSGACVVSGLGPTGCFYGAPAQADDFLNQCSAAQCLAFDDCARLGLCDDATDVDAALVPPPAPSSTSSDAGAATDASPALPLCLDPGNGRSQVIFITGSSNFPPLLAKLSPLVLATGYTPVYCKSLARAPG